MNRAKISGLALSFLLLAAGFASAGQVIVTFNSSVRDADRTSGIESLGGRVVKNLHLINALAAVFPSNVRTSVIFSISGVIRVEEDLYLKWIEEAPAALPLSYVSEGISALRAGQSADPGFIPAPVAPLNTPEETEIPWGVKRVNAAGAWDVNTGKGVKVAIIDTGIDYTHPDLAAHYAGGYNAVSSTSTPLDDHGHGTHVAGTVGAIRDAKGVVGVAPEAQLYAVKVLDAKGSGTYSNIIAGIQWAVDNKIQVINMSLGGSSGTPALASAMTAADKAGVTIVCAAGNSSGVVGYPARYPEAIAVSASDSTDKITSFSCRGPEIAFIAPGANINSCYKGGGYKAMSGTSMSSPHVAGLAALAIASGAGTPAQVRAALKKASVSLGLKPTEEGAGMIDAAKIGR
jgi:subtilisin